jgi:hypothetical protein
MKSLTLGIERALRSTVIASAALSACATAESLDDWNSGFEPPVGGAGGGGQATGGVPPGMGGAPSATGGAPLTGGAAGSMEGNREGGAACEPGFISVGGVCIPEVGGEIDGGCGTAICGEDEVCFEGACCEPQTCADLPGQCGTLSDGCGGSITCDSGCSIFRVTEYPVSSSNSSWNVTLNQPLMPNYFIVMRGSRGNNNPTQFYARLVQDPHGTGQLGSADVNASQFRFTRDTGTGTWAGTLSVVECLFDCEVNGFRLLDVRLLDVGGESNGTLTSAVPWTDLDRVMIVGGPHGPGVQNSSTSNGNTARSHFDFVPSGSDTISWARPDTGGRNRTPVMVVQWGSAWTVQRRALTGSANGPSAAVDSHYDTVAIDPVPRANTWVWGTGYTTNTSNTAGTSEATLLTLGNGVDVNAEESTLAAGQQVSPGTKHLTVYALTHPQLVVDHQFRPNDSGGVSGVDILTNSASGCGPSNGGRMAIAYNGGASDTDFPAWIFHARYENDTTIRMRRTVNSSSNDGSNWAAWVQGIQFCNIVSP